MKRTPRQLQIEHVAPETLLPSLQNPRTISPAQMAALERSIAEFGMVDPILVRRADRRVIGGNQRLEAARKLGLKTVPVVFLSLSEQQASLLNLALNKIQGEWDLEKLTGILTELRELPQVDITLSGFDSQELEGLLAQMQAEGPLPELPEDIDVLPSLEGVPSRVKRGELWRLGRHRLVCEDTLEAGVLERVCERPVPLVVTDPPYGIDYRSRMSRPGRRKAPIAHDESAGYEGFLEQALPALRAVMEPGATLYWFAGGGGPQPSLGYALLAISRHFSLQNCLVWDKETPGLGWRWRRTWEAVIEASLGEPAHWYGGTHRSNVLHCGKLIPQADDHPTPKPTNLLAELIRVSAPLEALVLDPFAGSGSTLIAAELTGRQCRAVELEPRYCDLVVARWEKIAGQQAGVEGE